jgi:hypothetical protein
VKVEDAYRGRYEKRDTPWDTGKPDFNPVEVVEQFYCVNVEGEGRRISALRRARWIILH